MGGYIAVGVMCLMVACKNNEYPVEELDLDKECENGGDR